MKHLSLFLGLLFTLTACSGDPLQPSRPQLPYYAWYIGLVAPRHMEVWVETVDVLDQRGYSYFHVFGGVASYTSDVTGLGKGTGASKQIHNVDLPERIFLRWQSLVEPQAYRITINIPQWVRAEMLRPEKVVCMFDKDESINYRNHITLGMAPGGIVKVWVGVGCLGYTEVGRFQAEVEPLGPYRGKSNGKYIPIEPENKAYIDKYGIPYGSW